MEGRWVLSAVMSVLVIVAGAVAARTEERTIRAAAPLESRARVFVTGLQQGFLLGVFAGRLAVEQTPSPLDGAQVVCPVAIDADYSTNTQRGEGRCIITAASGDRLFARWTCAGEPDKGCAGRFVLTGGTGAYQGVTGESDLAVQITLTGLVQVERLETEYDLKALASWPALRYRTP